MNTPNNTKPNSNPRAQRSVRASVSDGSNPARVTAVDSRLSELKVTAHTTALTCSEPVSDLRFYRQTLMPNQEACRRGVGA